jgi:hypothetical protein
MCSVMIIVFGSMLPILLELNSSKCGTPRSRGARRRARIHGRRFHQPDVAAGHLRIERADEVATLHREDEAAVAEERDRVRIFRLAFGILYSVTFPVFGSALPMSPAALPVCQMLPSASGAGRAA